MARGFNLARTPSGTPNTQKIKATAAQTFTKGALVVDVAAGTISECGADPASVLGVAMQGAFTGPGNSIADSSGAVITGTVDRVVVAIADRSQIFSCRGVNGGTDPVTPAQTNIGEQYGVVKVSNDWALDLADAVNVVCEIVDVDVDNKIFFVKFLESVLALP